MQKEKEHKIKTKDNSELYNNSHWVIKCLYHKLILFYQQPIFILLKKT